ncbi:MAG: radical SAM protein [SAR324 cluster bacterium]|nr:radical SAM protein [SAR324 cluster bacterium]
MAKALLIAPPQEGLVGKRSRKFHRCFPPLSLLLTASLLRQEGWEVELNDLNADRSLTSDQVQKTAEQCELVVLTTNPYADWQCPTFAVQSIFEFARHLPSERLVLTGNHGTHFPGTVLRETHASIVVREEPEWAIAEIAQAFRSKGDFSKIQGISYRVNDQNHHNPQRLLQHMDELPAPAYDLVDLKNYHYELLGGNFAILETSRGCPYSCNFCNLTMFQDGYRKRSPEKFLNELDELVEKHGCRSLYIFDLEFTINRKMVKAVCKHLIEKDYAGRYGFRWACQTRADSVKEDLLKEMKRSGCSLIHFGVEAGNPEIIKNTQKKIVKERIQEGIRATQDAGIQTAAFFIFGHPGESMENYQETLDFALDLSPSFASFHPFLSFPGSPLFTEKYGKGPYWEDPIRQDVTYFTPEQEEQTSQFVKKAYVKFYIRPRYIWQLLTRGDWGLYLRQLKLFGAFLTQG